jgi:hypothetical protein
MKKFFLSLTIGTALLSTLPALGQGYVQFSSATRGTWDDWSTPGFFHVAATNRVAFLYGSGTPLVDSYMPFVPTNQLAVPAGAWSAILNDPNFTLATNSDTGLLISQLCGASGSWNVTGTQPVVGTVVNQTYQIYVIGWDGNYPDPQSAAAASAAVGWSDVFSYTTVSVIGTPLSMPASGLLPFGVTVVPEPTTFTLGGLGAVVWFSLRRSKR